MGLGPQVFTVLTEFRFDIGNAVVNSRAVQDAVGGISAAADNALLSFQRLSAGLVASMGLGTGGILGVMHTAMQASDKFGQSQRALANIFLSNNLFKGADSFEQAMAAAAKNMEVIRNKAQGLSLPAGDMLTTTKLIGASLVSHGLDDASLHRSTEIARGFLKSAPILGIDPSLAQGQLLDAAMGRASMGDTFMQRLMNETSEMKQFKGNAQAFNALPDAKRIQTLTAALLQFGSNTKVVEANARSLSGEFQRLKDSLLGTFSILRPIGDVINAAVVPTLHRVNNFLQKEGAIIVKHFAKIMEGMVTHAETTLATLMQARALNQDLKRAGLLTFLYGLALGAVAIMKYFGIATSVLRLFGVGLLSLVTTLWTGLVAFGSWAARLAIFATGATSLGAALFTLANGFVILASRILVPLAIVTTVLQLISRAIAIARIDDVKALANAMGEITRTIAKLKVGFMHVARPFLEIFDAIARGIAPVFKFSYYLEYLVSVLDFAGDVLIAAQAGLNGVFFAIFQFVENIVNLVRGQGSLNIFKGIGDAFNAGIDTTIDEIMKKIESGDAVMNQTTNIAKVEINNAFKEQMEPDRIAFTLQDQLLKVAANRGQSSGRSLRAAEVGGF